MLHNANASDRFVRALHRRFVLLRAAERMGWALWMGCGAAAVTMPLVWWRGGSVLAVSLFMLALSLLLGLLVSILRRPTLLDAAMEADRQLKLHDLLSTSLAIRQAAPQANTLENGWAVTVSALADARCQSLSPSMVLLRRWGTQRWGSVGLSTVLILLLSIVLNRTSTLPKAMAVNDVFAPVDDLGVVRQDPGMTSSTVSRPTLHPARTPATDTPPNANDAPVLGSQDSVTDSASPDRHAEKPVHPNSAGDPTGHGGGSAQSKADRATLPPTETPSASAAKLAGHGHSAAGGVADNRSSNGQSDRFGSSAGTTSANRTQPTASWQSADGLTDQDRARQQMRSQSRYDQYHDMIEGYFDRK